MARGNTRQQPLWVRLLPTSGLRGGEREATVTPPQLSAGSAIQLSTARRLRTLSQYTGPARVRSRTAPRGSRRSLRRRRRRFVRIDHDGIGTDEKLPATSPRLLHATDDADLRPVPVRPVVHNENGTTSTVTIVAVLFSGMTLVSWFSPATPRWRRSNILSGVGYFRWHNANSRNCCGCCVDGW